MAKAHVEPLEVARIVTDQLMQVRENAEIDPAELRRLEKVMESEDVGLIDVFRIKRPEKLAAPKLLLVSGHKRLAIAKGRELETIEANVHDGTELEAFAFSRGQNRCGGGRTDGDVKHAAVQAFELRKSKQYEWFSDAKIAEWLHVTRPYVSKLRQEWEQHVPRRNDGQSESAETTSRPSGRSSSSRANGRSTKPPPPPRIQPQPLTLPERPSLAVATEQGAEEAAWLEDEVKARKKGEPDPLDAVRKEGFGLLHLLARVLEKLKKSGQGRGHVDDLWKIIES